MSIRALVVDDSASLRHLLVSAVEPLGARCVEACDGAEALKQLHAAAFDIILTDINMPILDGLKLVSHIRQDPASATVPIVVITTESAAVDRERALKLGASAYLVKPVQPGVVAATVARLLRRGEADAR